MKRVYFVRHGESVGNAEGVFKDPHCEMTETGHKQAKALAERCKTLGIQKIISSPNKRALQTAQYIADTTQAPVVESSSFGATQYASKMIGKSKTGPEAEEYMRILQEVYEEDADARYEDAENFNDLKNRFTSGYVELQQDSAEVLLVVTHESILKSLLVHALLEGNQTIEEHVRTKKTIGKFDHLGVTQMVFDGKRWQLLVWNDLVS